jgi:transcription initiation factor IIE alpha subunit
MTRLPNTQVQSTSVGIYLTEVVSTLHGRHKQVVEAMKRGKNHTNSELSEILGWSINRVTPRVKELREREVVVEDERRECKVTGRYVIAWKLAIKGQQNLSLFD